MAGSPVIARRLRELFRAFFPPRPRPTTRAERELVAANGRAWRTLGIASLLLLAPLVVAALHLFVDLTWIPRELS